MNNARSLCGPRGGFWLAAVSLVALVATPASAADLYWSGTGTWDTTPNTWGTTQGGPYNDATWNNATPDAAVFEGTAGTVTLGEPITAAGLTFAIDGYTVTGNTLTLSGTPSISTGSGVSATIASVLAGSDLIDKTGAGTLTLSAANTHSGGTIISAGTIILGTNTSLGSGTITLDGGSIERNAVETISNAIAVGAGGGTIVAAQPIVGYTNFTGQLTGSGGLSLDGLVQLSGTGSTYSSTITLADADTYLRFSSDSAIAATASIAAGNAKVRLDAATVTLDALTMSSGGTVFNVNTDGRTASVIQIGSGQVAGLIYNNEGQLAVEKTGPGTLTLSGNNSYSGGTTISGGTVVVGNQNAFGAKASGDVTRVVVNSGGAVNFNGVGDATYGYTIAGSGDGNGALVNTGAEIGTGTAQTTNILLSADATIGGTANWALLTSGFGATSLDLAGFTLTKTGGNAIRLRNSTITAGTIAINQGRLTPLAGTNGDSGVAVTLANAANTFLRVENGGTFTIGSLAGGGATGGSVELVNSSLTVGGLNTDTTFSGQIQGTSGTGRLTKVGTGTLTLARSNTYTGGTTVSGGSLNLDASGAIGTGSLTIDAGASVNSLRAFGISTDAAAAGRVVNVAGSLSMADTEYVQTYNLTAGTIAAPVSGAGYLRAPTAGLTINSLAAAASSQITGQFDLTFSSATLDVADGAAVDDLVISGNISQNTGAGSGAKSLTKTGGGTLLLSGTNSYSGGTFINGGLVKAGSSRALGAENAAASTVTIGSGATLDINRVTGNTGDFVYGMTIAGSGTAGQGALINTGANGSTGLQQTPNITLSADAAIGGSGNILMIAGGYAANDLDLAGNTLMKTGSNTFFLCNTTVSAGTIDIQQGTLSHFNNAANVSAASVSLADAAGATLALNNLGLQVGSLAGGGSTGGNVTLGSATLTLGGRNEDTSFGGLISGTGAVVKTGTGTQTFAAANTYSGGTTINSGTLVAGVANAFGTTGTITVNAGGTLGVGSGVDFTGRAFTLNTGGKVWLGDNATIALPDAAALAAFETSNTAGGDGTVADILYGSGATTPSALTSAWTANPGGYFSDILTLEGTGAGNTYVLSMTYSGSFGDMNIWYRPGTTGPFTPLGTSYQGDVAWNSGFTTVGQYGFDSASGTVWAVTDHNSQFVVVPEPGTLGLAAAGLAGSIWYLHRKRVATRS